MPDDLPARLRAWYRAHARDLPWRAPDRTPWGVLVSEVMLQQTPVARVEPAWRAWLTRWPAPVDLALADPADVLRAWDRLGYPRRALRLQQTAVALVDRYDGAVPDDEAALRSLPGVGSYTAAAVRAFAFGRRAVVLDTNVRRVLERLLGGHALPPDHQTRAEVLRADAFLPPARPAHGPDGSVRGEDGVAAATALALMELGATVCTARAPRCADCPVASDCRWLAAGRPADEHAATRRRQAWTGTDRQARGRVMAALRAADAPVVPEQVGWPDAGQLARAVASLLADGLAVVDADGGLRLPGVR